MRLGGRPRFRKRDEGVADDPADAPVGKHSGAQAPGRTRSPARSSRGPPIRSGRSPAPGRCRQARAAARARSPAGEIPGRTKDPRATGRDVRGRWRNCGKKSANAAGLPAFDATSTSAAGRGPKSAASRSAAVPTQRWASFSYSASSRIIAWIAPRSSRRAGSYLEFCVRSFGPRYREVLAEQAHARMLSPAGAGSPTRSPRYASSERRCRA